ncbi:hypothetical protein NP233_g4941 [Leucocoprinus birnbaumii]|uniref:C2H2-type domain-containing protein n=1 Tax=Leucocoprinus birnbaumii TaxID=56174 RepID=A0AAD5VW26_9AGAR|nr:hypothetical protein NP233_g4941 [Leucocoprinus birnbaumii]
MSTAVLCQTNQVLGKRGKAGTPLFSFLRPREPKVDDPSESKGYLSPVASSSSSSAPVIINGKLQKNTKKRYHCIHKGCDKAYSKPSRLAEHERSHTGERPYKCETCNKSYLRETHLHAHARSHLPETSRPFICDKPGCDKRFWTSQHLRVHIGGHEGAKPFTCPEDGCSEAFAKHNQLRSHIATVHSPPGTKPYQCEQPECSKSFSTNQQLKAHAKTHDDKRYTCIHIQCLATSGETPTYFPNWSALQNHIRNAHPPTCTHEACAGRTFTTQKGLRAHMKLHEQRDMMEILEDDSADDEADHQPAKRRRGGDWGRDWKCDFENCAKDFKSKKALTVHKNVTHLGHRKFVCPHENCHKAYGYKHLLQRHTAKAHRSSDGETSSEYSDDALPASDEEEDDVDVSLVIEKITGYAYSQSTQAKITAGKALRCPFPDISGFEDANQRTENLGSQKLTGSTAREGTCDYAFRRAYDLRRHLQATHGLSAQKEAVELWVAEQKLAWYT